MVKYDSLEVGVTSACNCDCIYCGVTKDPIVDDLNKVENFIPRINELELLNPDTEGFISITGGEPLLVPSRTMKLISDIREYYPNKELVLNTNGTIYTEKIFDMVDTIHVSVNGAYDKLMVATDFVEFRKPCMEPEKHYAKLRETLSTEYPKTIETILTRWMTPSKLKDIYRYIKTIPNVGLWEMSVMAPVKDRHWDIFLTEKMLKWVLGRFMIEGYDEKIPIRINCCYLDDPSWHKYIRKCPEGVDRIHVDIDGDVTICDIGCVCGIKFGNIYEDNMDIGAMKLYQGMSPHMAPCQWLRILHGDNFENLMVNGK